MTRRDFLRATAWGSAGLFCAPLLSRAAPRPRNVFRGRPTFDRILKRATDEGWANLPIGQLMGKISRELEGIPYVGFTIESSPDVEECVVDFTGLDCVTFFENTLGFARMLKHGGSTPEDLLSEVTFTRYRGGKIDGYVSRLHYTTDWFVDNEAKGTVRILTPDLPGARQFTQPVGFMSKNPELYRQLKAHPELVDRIRETERTINARKLMYLPLESLAEAEPLLQTGDIVGVCTKAEGLDIAHTGLIWVDEGGTRHFFDASSAKSRMKVTLEPRISTCLNWSKNLTGVMFARPLEPQKGSIQSATLRN